MCTTESLAHHLLSLPRELRDLIYPYVVTFPSPIPLDIATKRYRPKRPSGPPPNAFQALLHYPQLAREAAEIYYLTNTFILPIPEAPSYFERCPWGSDIRPTPHIRHLIVSTTETFTPDHTGPNSKESLPDVVFEAHLTALEAQKRRVLTSLLDDLPKLATLDIRIQKSVDANLEARDLNPFIQLARLRRPQLNLNVSLSFDNLLKEAWDDPIWSPQPGLEAERLDHEYQAAGKIDITGMFAPPTEEDKKYVRRFIPRGRMPKGRPIVQGLLDHSVEDRRTLMESYIVHDPVLFRVKMEEHWKLCRQRNPSGMRENEGAR